MSMNSFWKNSVGEELPCYIDSNTYGGNSQGTTRDYAARARGQVISKAAFVYDSMISYSSIHSTDGYCERKVILGRPSATTVEYVYIVKLY